MHLAISLGIVAVVVSCAGQPCHRRQIPCLDGSACIGRLRFCDGKVDCRDGSDERLRNIHHAFETNTVFCRGKGGRICVLPTAYLLHRKKICDENWRCRDGELSCADGSQCIEEKLFCNGRENCRDGSDESRRKNIHKRESNLTTCSNKNGAHENNSSRGQPGPTKQSSTKEISPGNAPRCRPREFPCEDGSRCIQAGRLCDDVYNCDDKSDEFPSPQTEPNDVWNSTLCRGRQGRICVLPPKYLSRKSDFCTEGRQCETDEFRCDDGSRCVGSREFCDGTANCRDESDERLWNRYTHYDDQVILYRRANGRICILPARSKSLRAHLCTRHPNLCQCVEWQNNFLDDNCFRCLSQPARTFPISRLCDGVVHCPDLSDECLCSLKTRLGICRRLILGNAEDEEEYSWQQLHFFKCNSIVNRTQITLLANRVCDGRTDCFSGEDEMGCYRNGSNSTVVSKWRKPPEPRTKNYECLMERNKSATKCDGVRECRHFKPEECDCPNPPEYCRHLGNHPILARCGDVEVHKHMMCNGIKDCEDFQDERHCLQTRFYCNETPLPNIPKEKQCDQIDDCPNGQDERHCSYFECNDNGTVKYLLQGQVCDGYKDCDSGWDECVCVDSVFSDEESMIKSKFVLGIVWIISLSAIIGCGAVVTVTVRDLIQPSKRNDRKPSNHTKLVKMTILSLSLSDFLVAIYTLSICIKAVELDEGYCKMDREWRSCATCSALGALLVIGSEQSVFTMVVIAGSRLFSVTSADLLFMPFDSFGDAFTKLEAVERYCRPFSHPDIRLATVVILLTWTISIILGTIPLIPSAEDYFLKSIMFEGSKLFKITYQNDTEHLINWIRLINNNQTSALDEGVTNWMKLRTLVKNVNPNISVAYEFGYYSSHTVCLPTLFPKYQDQAWPFTLLLLIINFLAFVVMLVMYIMLYRRVTADDLLRQSNSSVQERRLKQSATMQRKITRILISDFLCWTPICIMGFLQMCGVPIPNDAYLPTGLLIIPINSSLNPLLYSDIPDIMMHKVTEFREFLWPARKKEPEVIELAVSGDTGKSTV